MQNCKGCQHESLRKMIQKPYMYDGDIPCLRCSRYLSDPPDLYAKILRPQSNGFYDWIER